MMLLRCAASHADGAHRQEAGMSKGLPKTVKTNVEKCRSAAVAAVDVYNRPGSRFRTAHYIVLIILAWTALMHAVFYSQGRRPWYRRPGAGIRYVKIDGDPEHWDLSECLSQHFGGQHPAERKNLEFLIGLRNKIEHRELPDLDAALYGECQAALLNLEEWLVTNFGKRYALTDQLAVSLQFSQLIPSEKKQAAKTLAKGVAASVTEYVERFRGGLPAAVLNSMKYSFNVFLVPKLANRKSAADASVQFINVNEASPEEIERLTRLNVLIREKHIPIANLDMFKPGKVVASVAAKLPRPFTIGTHTLAWKHYAVRPQTGAQNPTATKSQFCVYDPAHSDYLYTQAWIDFLAEQLADECQYHLVARVQPAPAPAAQAAPQDAAAAGQIPDA
jgi:hypothetical protein